MAKLEGRQTDAARMRWADWGDHSKPSQKIPDRFGLSPDAVVA
jgi:hypothetical protein